MKLLYISLASCLFLSCTNKKASDQQKTTSPKKTSTEKTTSADTLTETETDDYLTPPKSDIRVYDLSQFDSRVLISLSDDYVLSSHKDSLAIPDLKNFEEEESQYLPLGLKYKKVMMSKMKIAETDSLFIYDYSANMLNAFAVKDLNAAAYINIYGAEWPYEASDYMIGFEVETKSLKIPDSNYYTTFVCIGPKNPFAMKKLQTIKWKEIAASKIPSVPVNPKYNRFMKGTTKKNAYSYTNGDLQYFLQDYAEKEDVTGRRLLVENKTTHEIVFENYYYNDEGGALTPLNFINPDGEIHQWTGKLFKNKSDVVFGFEYASFGCSTIPFISKTEPVIFRSCDNRH